MVDLPEEGLPSDFGKYRLEKRIATGGMAEIFLAHRRDAPMEPLVIKRILPHLVKSGEFVSMFLDEARIAAQLKHKNVVSIEDVGQIDGAYYIAMEYVHGEDIRRIYNRAYKLQRSLPLSHSIRVIADAALGLGYAHKLRDLTGKPMGVVHRDVSPQNILVTYEGDAKVVDFGIAKAANKVAQTRAGVLKGKYSYMSPEQALGDPIDHRTDIFALGIILYETTTGTRLFKRHNELATLQAIIKCEFVPPSEALPNYPPELEQVLLRALEKDPDLRYDDAEEFSAALYDFLYDSELYVEREVVADFMQDLFSDRLEEEEDSGQPALPDADEVREEMADSTTPNRARPQEETFEPSVIEERDAPATIPDPSGPEALAPGPGFLPPGILQGGGATALEADLEDIAHKAYVAPDIVDPAESAGERRKRTEIVRPDRKGTELGELDGLNGLNGNEDQTNAERGGAPDEAPTVAAHPSYRPPVSGGIGAQSLPPESVPPERASGVRRRDEHTEQVRREKARTEKSREARKPTEPVSAASLRRAPRAEETQEEWPPLDEPSPQRTMLIGILVGAAIVVAVVTGVVVSRFVLDREPGRAQDVRPTPKAGELTVLTEPGAIVYAQGDVLGEADGEGVAGPFEVPVGPVLIRVANEAIGFDRTRELDVDATRAYEIEIRARHGWLRIAVAPWARVTMDGKDIGLTPLPKLTLTEGLHQLVLENPDIKKRYESTVRVEADKASELRIDLNDVGERM